MTTTIVLVRHGETDWNAERRVQGHTDRPLNETGRAQARALADQLAREQFDAVYSSDLLRAYETARIVAERLGLAVATLRELREKDFGSWEGLTDTVILERFPDARSGAWGDGETAEELGMRVLDALRRIAAAHPGRRVLVVTHGGPVRAVLGHCDDRCDRPVGNCHVATVAAKDGELRRVH